MVGLVKIQEKPKTKKFKNKQDAIKYIAKKANANMTKKHLKEFLSGCNI